MRATREQSSSSPAAPRSHAISNSGFTLLELVVVLAIFALAATVGIVSLRDGWSTPRLRPYAQSLATELKAARASAILGGRPVAFVLDGANRTYRMGDARSAVRIPAGFNLALQVPHGSPGRLEFYPDGSSNGGVLTISLGNSAVAVDIEWLTGSVRVR